VTNDSYNEVSMQPTPTPRVIVDEPVGTENPSIEVSPLNDLVVSDPVGMDDNPTAESVAENWKGFQLQTATFFEKAKLYLIAFFKDNQQLLVTLGILFLAIVAARLFFAGLSAIDDIPLFTPLLKIVGLVSVVRFVWRYLIREQNRQELIERINQTKMEVFGS
jgi:hypothetical protein